MLAAESSVGRGKLCRMGILVDGRTRLSEGDGTKTAKLSSYFGNVLSVPFVVEKSAVIKEKTLSWAADTIHDCIQGAAKKDHFLDLIDWVEAHRPEPIIPKICAMADEHGPNFVVSSGLRFEISKADFGAGGPDFASIYLTWDIDLGYVMPMQSPFGDGDWVVFMHLMEEQLDWIENRAGHLFRPLSTHDLGLGLF